MYEYECVSLSVGFTGKVKGDYKAVIQEHAKKGWRLKQIVTPPFSAYGQAQSMDIIFEKEIQ